MLGRDLGLAISCALGASAFLLPPGVSSEDAALPFAPYDPKHQLLELPCPTCDYLDTPHEYTLESASGVLPFDSSNLLLDLTITQDGRALLLNEEQLYPPSYAIENIIDFDWSIEQVPASLNRNQLESKGYKAIPRLVTGHMYSTSPMDMLTPDGDGIITIRWQLLSLEHEMVSLDEVLIQLLHTGDDELLILSADLIPVPEDIVTIKPLLPVDASERPTNDCKYLPGPLCKLANFIGSENLRPGCGGAKKFDPFDGRLPTHIKPHFGPLDDNDDNPHMALSWPEGFDISDDNSDRDRIRPLFPEGRGHGGHHAHRHHRSFFHAVGSAITAVLFPAMLGIGVGLLVLPLGLLTGHFLGWLWFTVILGRKRDYARVVLDDTSDANANKSEQSVESAEPLPLYEEAPAYEATEKEAV